VMVGYGLRGFVRSKLTTLSNAPRMRMQVRGDSKRLPMARSRG